MAKKALVDSIIKLYSKLGGNVGEVLGTRTNISFLGTGKSPEGFIDSTINIDAIGALGKNKVLEELKSSIGYLTADKLNDLQAGKLYENMLKIDKVFNPPIAPANIIDLGTGIRNLNQEGLGALRVEEKLADDVMANVSDAEYTIRGYFPKASDAEIKRMLDNPSKEVRKILEVEGIDLPAALRATRKTDDDMRIIKDEALTRFPEETHQFMGRPLKDADFAKIDQLVKEGKIPPAAETVSPLMGRIESQMEKIRGTSSKLDDAIKGYEDVWKPRGTNEIDALETMTKNRASHEFITGYVDEVYKKSGVVSAVDVPKKRAAARAFLNSMLKKETDFWPNKGGTLESVISPTDYKFVTEGGGGALGDPLVLVKKYFGDEVARRLPLDTRTEVIDTFVDNVRFTKDRAGFPTNDPRFNPDDIPEFKHGGLAKILEV